MHTISAREAPALRSASSRSTAASLGRFNLRALRMLLILFSSAGCSFTSVRRVCVQARQLPVLFIPSCAPPATGSPINTTLACARRWDPSSSPTGGLAHEIDSCSPPPRAPHALPPRLKNNLVLPVISTATSSVGCSFFDELPQILQLPLPLVRPDSFSAPDATGEAVAGASRFRYIAFSIFLSWLCELPVA